MGVQTGRPGGAAWGEGMQNKARSPESSSLRQQCSSALKNLLKQPVTPQGGESITTAASQAPFNFATYNNYFGSPRSCYSSHSFPINLLSTAVKLPWFPPATLLPRSNAEILLPPPMLASPLLTTENGQLMTPAPTGAGQPAQTAPGLPGHSLSMHLIN